MEENEKKTPAETAALLTVIRQAQAGSMDALDALRRRYVPLLKASVARYDDGDLTLQEKEDLTEEANRIFLEALSSFDAGQEEVSFGLYARVCLHNGLVSAMRHLDHLRRQATLASDEVPSLQDPADRMVEQERFLQLCDLVRANLSEFENRVWWDFVSGVSVATIAASLGKDERSIHNAIYRIRRKLRERLTRE